MFLFTYRFEPPVRFAISASNGLKLKQLDRKTPRFVKADCESVPSTTETLEYRRCLL